MNLNTSLTFRTESNPASSTILSSLEITRTQSVLLKGEKVNEKASALCSFADTALIYMLIMQVTEFYYELRSPLKDHQFVLTFGKF